MKHLPNILSLFRILLVFVVMGLFLWPFEPTLPWVINDAPISPPYVVIGLVFIIASLTDWLDGYLARKWKVETTLGKLIDPLADKLIVNVSMLFLAFQPSWVHESQMIIPVWVVALWLIRDFTVDGLRLIAASKQVIIAAHPLGKFKTVLQMMSIVLIFFNDLPFASFSNLLGFPITEIILYFATLISLLSGYYYLKSHWSLLKGTL